MRTFTPTYSQSSLTESDGSDGKTSTRNLGDLDSIPGSGRSPGEEAAMNSSTLAWKIPWMERSDRLHRVAKNPTRLSDFTFTVQS